MELISREEVARLIYEQYAVPPKCCKEILELHTIESRPKGVWKQISPAKIYECTNCHQNVMTNDIVAYEWCHRCGADMRGEE